MKKALLTIILLVLFMPTSVFTDDAITSTTQPIYQVSPDDGNIKSADKAEMDTGDSEGTVYIRPSELLDFDEESQIIYGRDRTLIKYKDISLEADRIIYNIRLNEVQADGNVDLTYKGEKVQASAVKYNLKYSEGEAYGVAGQRGLFHFSSPEVIANLKKSYNLKESEKAAVEGEPTFKQINKNEAVLNNTSFTTCDFPIPHYRVRAKEAVIYLNDRVFIRGAWLYIREFPVVYIPVYTRSLKGASPWSTGFGYSSKLGGYMRFGYEYRNYLQEPSFTNENKYATRSEQTLATTLNYFTERGAGAELQYRYNLLYGRHIGKTYLFGVGDNKRDVEGEPREQFRWIAKSQLSSEIMKDFYLQADIDEFSDAEIYYDFLDKFQEETYGRRAERYVGGAATLNKDYYVARIMAQFRERITRDRLTNYTDQADNDRDYDLKPDENDWKDHGLSNSRFGTVSLKAPQAQFNSNKIPLFKNFPLFYNFYVDAFNNLDKGLNSKSRDDDAWLRGVDFYQTLTHQIKFSERLSWINTIGGGAAYFDRQYDSWKYDYPATKNDNGTPGTTDDDYWLIDTTKFSEEDEVILGDRRASLRDVRNDYYYYDYVSRISMRLSESLKAYLKYTYRDSTNNSIGELYESLGSNYTRNDLYNFRLKKNWVEAMLRYNLFYPDMSFSISGGQNLQSESDIYANEPLNYAKSQITWTSQDKTLTISPGVTFSKTQINDPTAAEAYEQKTLQLGSSLAYTALSKLWWFNIGSYWYEILNEEGKNDTDNDKNFTEGESKLIIDGKIGRKIGPKYTIETGGRYDSREKEITRAHVGIARDMHDVIVQLLFGYRKDTFDDKKEWEVRIALQPKTAEESNKVLRKEFSIISIEEDTKTDKAAVED